MNDSDLDQCYSTLSQALADVGQDGAPLFLAMVCLALISRMDNAQQVLPLIAQAQARCQDGTATRAAPEPGQSGMSSSG